MSGTGVTGLDDQPVTAVIEERVPEFAWRDSNLLAAYLGGLFDADGTVSADGALLTFGQSSTHLRWAREVQEGLLLLGIRSRINAQSNTHPEITLHVPERYMPIFSERVGFIDLGRQRVRPQYAIADRVEAVEFTDEYVEMYDVVNSETGRFMANGMIVHNSNADMTKLALIYIRSALKDWEARTVNTVHDEIVVEVRNDQAEEVKQIVEHEMVRAGEMILKSVPVVADASLADYWSK
jgi:hypothetical protein